jgi:prevent-host-death family protein
MRVVSATDAKQRFAAILDAAQREPVLIRRQNRDVAVLISAEDYERMRAATVEEFLRASQALSREAKAKGLTAKKLQKLLEDE